MRFTNCKSAVTADLICAKKTISQVISQPQKFPMPMLKLYALRQKTFVLMFWQMLPAISHKIVS